MEPVHDYDAGGVVARGPPPARPAAPRRIAISDSDSDGDDDDDDDDDDDGTRNSSSRRDRGGTGAAPRVTFALAESESSTDSTDSTDSDDSDDSDDKNDDKNDDDDDDDGNDRRQKRARLGRGRGGRGGDRGRGGRGGDGGRGGRGGDGGRGRGGRARGGGRGGGGDRGAGVAGRRRHAAGAGAAAGEAGAAPVSNNDGFGEYWETSVAACVDILQEPQRPLHVYKLAFEEMERKWIRPFRDGAPGRMNAIPQILHNFRLKYNPADHELSFRTTAAAAQATQQRLAHAHKSRPRRDGGEDGPETAADGHVTITGGLALLEAFTSEVSLAYSLQAFMAMEHYDFGEAFTFREEKRWAIIHVIDVINKAHRMADNWYCMQKQVDDHATDGHDPDDTQNRDFPYFLDGCEGRLRLHMQSMTPYHKVMLYLLEVCRKNRYRRHGAWVVHRKHGHHRAWLAWPTQCVLG